jgi:hypothetical protein
MNREQIVSNQRSCFYKNLEKENQQIWSYYVREIPISIFYYGLKRKISTHFKWPSINAPGSRRGWLGLRHGDLARGWLALVRPGGHARPRLAWWRGIWCNNIKYLYSEEINKQNYISMENSTYCVQEVARLSFGISMFFLFFHITL